MCHFEVLYCIYYSSKPCCHWHTWWELGHVWPRALYNVACTEEGVGEARPVQVSWDCQAERNYSVRCCSIITLVREGTGNGTPKRLKLLPEHRPLGGTPSPLDFVPIHHSPGFPEISFHFEWNYEIKPIGVMLYKSWVGRFKVLLYKFLLRKTGESKACQGECWGRCCCHTKDLQGTQLKAPSLSECHGMESFKGLRRRQGGKESKMRDRKKTYFKWWH